jgi:two-component system response regulator YesN
MREGAYLKAISLRNKPMQIFLKFFIPYLLILVFPFTMGYISYNQTVLLLEEEAQEANIKRLEQVRQTLDQRLLEIHAISHQVTSNPRVVSFQLVKAPYEGTAPIRILETRGSIYDYTLTNQFISQYALYFKNSEIVITSNTSYDFTDFYSRIFRYKEGDYTSWKSKFMDTYYYRTYLPARSAVINGINTQIVTYIQTLGYPSLLMGAFVVLIDESKIQQLLKSLSLSDGGWAYVADRHGTVISSLGKPKNIEIADHPPSDALHHISQVSIDDEEYVVTTMKSEMTEWNYVAVQPVDLVLMKVNRLKKLFAFLLLGALILGIVFALWMATRASFPLRKIFRQLTDQFQQHSQDKQDVYRMIHDTLSHLAQNNQQLEGEVRRQKPYFQSAVIERLLQGKFDNDSEAQLLLEHTGVSVHDGYVTVAVMLIKGKSTGRLARTEGLGHLDLTRVQVKERLGQMLGAVAYIHDLTPERIAILFHVKGDEPKIIYEQLNSILVQVRRTLYDQECIETSIAVGGIYNSLLDYNRSYREAMIVYNENPWDWKEGSGIIWFDQLPDFTQTYDFPPDVHQQLLVMARAGEKEEGCRLIQALYDTNINERALSFSMRRLFFQELKGSVVKIAGLIPQIQAERRFSLQRLEFTLDTAADMEQLYVLLIQVYSSMCDILKERKKNRNITLADKMVEYIQDHYTYSDFGVTKVADAFQISENYLSQLFRDQTGLTFTDYLLKLRMERAQSLLLETELSIKEIAGMVGYNSMNTFGRAFKRYYGVNATAYRSST